MYSLLKSFALIVLLFSYCITLNVQWSSDPAVNLQVCDVLVTRPYPKLLLLQMAVAIYHGSITGVQVMQSIYKDWMLWGTSCGTQMVY